MKNYSMSWEGIGKISHQTFSFPKRKSLVTVTELFVGCQNERHIRSVRSIMRRFKTVSITATIIDTTDFMDGRGFLMLFYPRASIESGFAFVTS
jgi:hypothetical protein